MEHRRNREKYWIKQLKTKYPYGLNSKLINNDPDTSVFRNFIIKPTQTNRPKRIHSKKHYNNILNNYNWSPYTFLHNFYNTFLKDNKTWRLRLINNILSLNKVKLKDIEDILFDYDFNINFTELILDLLKYKSEECKLNKKSIKSIDNRSIIFLKFVNIINNKIHPNEIINNNSTKQYWPIPINNDQYSKYIKPKILYSYDRPIGNLIFNYRHATNNNETIKETNKQVCICNQSRYSNFINIDHRHVITGNMDIILNTKLKDLFIKGPKYRLSKSANIEDYKNSFMSDIKKYITKISLETKLDIKLFNMWLIVTEKMISTKLQSKGYIINNDKDEKLDNNMKKELEFIRKHFIITRVDKAAQNFAIICKKHYLNIIQKELNNKETYNMCELDQKDIIFSQNMTIYDKFNLTSNTSNTIPIIQIIPKFHKTPVKFRTIISSSDSKIEIISKRLTKVLRFIMTKLKKYTSTMFNNIGINFNWIISNHKSILNDIKMLSKTKKMKNINTYDFTTLYTSIKHDEIKIALNNIIDMAFHNNNELKIITIGKDIKWTYTKNMHRNNYIYTYTSSIIKNMISWLLNNTYFRFGDTIYKQNIGIPMGTSSAPFLANLFLFHYEFNYLKNNMRLNYYKCKKLNYTYRYIDDITTINDDNYFSKIFKDIYPSSLELIKINSNNKIADILDLNINIDIKGTCTSKLYDKRRDFNFKINNFPDPRGNISESMCYNVVLNEITRISNISTLKIDFENDVQTLFNKLKLKGYNQNRLNSIREKMEKKINQIN